MAADLKSVGDLALKEKRFDDAIKSYSQAIELQPENEILFSNRSAAHLSKGDAAAALADGERCVQLKATWPKGHGRIAAAYHKMGQYDDACMAYEVS